LRSSDLLRRLGPVSQPQPQISYSTRSAIASLGWHVVTDYQRRVLGELLDDLEAVPAPVPTGCVKVAFGETPPAYAVLPGCRVATHSELDPVHRADPWNLLCDWLRARASR
jgi:hypothetical protein